MAESALDSQFLMAHRSLSETTKIVTSVREGILLLVKMNWQEIVAKKLRIQGEAIQQVTAVDGNADFDEVDLCDKLSKYFDDGEILNQLASAEISSEALVACRIRQ